MTLAGPEFNALEKLAKKTKCDCWFLIAQDEHGDDYIHDLESDERISLAEGVAMLCDALVEPLKNYGLTKEEEDAFTSLCYELLFSFV